MRKKPTILVVRKGKTKFIKTMTMCSFGVCEEKKRESDVFSANYPESVANLEERKKNCLFG